MSVVLPKLNVLSARKEEPIMPLAHLYEIVRPIELDQYQFRDFALSHFRLLGPGSKKGTLFGGAVKGGAVKGKKKGAQAGGSVLDSSVTVSKTNHYSHIELISIYAVTPMLCRFCFRSFSLCLSVFLKSPD